ncbi:hypothetical protein NC651_030411 [Populus alba x Populus x berolinensis]|nr:hypothetical protein NC651_030411 [Populus alba x Populus x berolinensis]
MARRNPVDSEGQPGTRSIFFFSYWQSLNAEELNRLPLRKLFYEDRETFLCSSLEADDTDSLQPGIYCVWTPKKEEGSPGSYKKSSFTGSNSKKWKFKYFIHRSNSDGKDNFVFLIPNNKKSGLHHQRLGTEKRKEAKGVGGGLFQFQEHYYVRSKEGDIYINIKGVILPSSFFPAS